METWEKIDIQFDFEHHSLHNFEASHNGVKFFPQQHFLTGILIGMIFTKEMSLLKKKLQMMMQNSKISRSEFRSEKQPASKKANGCGILRFPDQNCGQKISLHPKEVDGC